MSEAMFGKVIPILSDEEYDDKQSAVWQRREAGDGIAMLQVMYHIATHMQDNSGMMVLAMEAMGFDEETDTPNGLPEGVFGPALNEILEAGKARLAAAEATAQNEKRAAYDAEPYYTADGREPNAVLIPTTGAAQLICVTDFDDSESLGEPLDCDRVDRVLNRIPDWSEKTFGVRLQGYVDANGMPKGLDENERMQSLSGYDYLAGDCVLVGLDDEYNYLPLTPWDAVTVWKHFNG